jgi:transposase
MDFHYLIKKMLGIQDVTIESFEEEPDSLSLKIIARQNRESCRCNRCDSPILGVHEWKERRLRAASLGAFLYVEVRLATQRPLWDL